MLVPVNVLQNWMDEFFIWLSNDNLFNIYTLEVTILVAVSDGFIGNKHIQIQVQSHQAMGIRWWGTVDWLRNV